MYPNEDLHDSVVTAFTEDRQFPWTRLGTTLNTTMSVEQALKEAGLSGWDVHVENLYTSGGVKIPKKVATVRGDNGKILGVTGSGYHILSNETSLSVAEDILDTSDIQPHTAGYLGDGQKVFFNMKVPEGIKIAGVDELDVNLLLSTSHDGSASLRFDVIMGRLQCFNALRPAIKGAISSWVVRHRSGADGRVYEARRALGLTFEYMDEFTKEMELLLDVSMTDYRFDKIVERMLPIREDLSPGRLATAQAKRNTVRTLFHDAPTNEFGRGTAYAAYNALTEYADHFLPVKGLDPHGIKRAERAMKDGIVSQFKDKAFQLVRP